MTDDEILARAAEIEDRRKRARRGREFMEADRVVIARLKNGDHDIRDTITVPQDANLAAMLCRLLDCNISEGGK